MKAQEKTYCRKFSLCDVISGKNNDSLFEAKLLGIRSRVSKISNTGGIRTRNLFFSFISLTNT